MTDKTERTIQRKSINEVSFTHFEILISSHILLQLYSEVETPLSLAIKTTQWQFDRLRQLWFISKVIRSQIFYCHNFYWDDNIISEPRCNIRPFVRKQANERREWQSLINCSVNYFATEIHVRSCIVFRSAVVARFMQRASAYYCTHLPPQFIHPPS